MSAPDSSTSRTSPSAPASTCPSVHALPRARGSGRRGSAQGDPPHAPDGVPARPAAPMSAPRRSPTNSSSSEAFADVQGPGSRSSRSSPGSGRRLGSDIRADHRRTAALTPRAPDPSPPAAQLRSGALQLGGAREARFSFEPSSRRPGKAPRLLDSPLGGDGRRSPPRPTRGSNCVAMLAPSSASATSCDRA